MEVAIIGPILGGVVSSTLPKLYSAIAEAGEKLFLKADVQSIQSELEHAQAAIQDYRSGRYDMSYVRRAWIKDLKRLAYHIEDLVDFHVAKKRKLVHIAAEIDQLKRSAEDINKRLHRYVSPESKQKAQDVASSSTSGAPTSDDQGIPGQAGHEVVGMDKALRDLTTLLQRSESPTEGNLKVISIVGFGGIGKTTVLAQKVYNGVHREYPLHAFVNAKGKDKEEILKEILENLLEQDENGTHGSSSSNEVSQHTNDVETQLKLCLGTNRYFIVIDGVRTEQLGCDMLSAFPQEEGVDRRIIVTTTIQSVAKACSCGDGHVYKMRPLEDDESEEPFFDIFSFKGPPSEAMKRIRKRVLDNNYKSLCSGLQCRLLYLCMFPSDHHIRRGPLIRRWLAEGSGMGCREPRMNFETLINQNFETLIDRNVIWPIQASNNEKVKACQLPGMTLEYITDISKSENFMMLSCGPGDAPQEIRRLSLHHTCHSDDMLVLQEDLSRLRTLAVFYEGKDQEDNLDFAKCELLRVLDLEACKCVNKSHLEKICNLLPLLKYLSLRASITKVPSEITSLQLLETLDLGKETVVKVPVDVIELPRLKHLLGRLKLLEHFRLKDNLIESLKRSMLETLAGFVTSKGQSFPPLMRHMRRLTKVKVWLDPKANTRKLTPLSEAIEEFLRKTCRMPKIRHSLSIDFQQESETFPDFSCAPDRRGRLFSLKLRGHGKLTQIPAFVTSVGGITELCLSSTTLIFGDDVLSGLSSLHVLEYLKLEATSSIEGDTEEGPVVIGREQLQSLKRMCLVAKEKLPCITIQPGALHSIVSLQLIWRGLDGRLPEGIKENWEEAAKGHPNRPHLLCTAGQKKQTLPVP